MTTELVGFGGGDLHTAVLAVTEAINKRKR
jgi:hypothetical protein